jgi:hypothetical protein
VKQSRYRYLGILDLLVVAAFVGLFGPVALTRNVVIPGMIVAGVLALLAGSVAAISVGPITVTWRHLIGVSYVTFALALPTHYAHAVLAGTASAAEIALFAAAAAGACSLLFYGVDVARDGRHFKVEADVETTVGG